MTTNRLRGRLYPFTTSSMPSTPYIATKHPSYRFIELTGFSKRAVLDTLRGRSDSQNDDSSNLGGSSLAIILGVVACLMGTISMILLVLLIRKERNIKLERRRNDLGYRYPLDSESGSRPRQNRRWSATLLGSGYIRNRGTTSRTALLPPQTPPPSTPLPQVPNSPSISERGRTRDRSATIPVGPRSPPSIMPKSLVTLPSPSFQPFSAIYTALETPISPSSDSATPLQPQSATLIPDINPGGRGDASTTLPNAGASHGQLNAPSSPVVYPPVARELQRETAIQTEPGSSDPQNPSPSTPVLYPTFTQDRGDPVCESQYHRLLKIPPSPSSPPPEPPG